MKLLFGLYAGTFVVLYIITSVLNKSFDPTTWHWGQIAMLFIGSSLTSVTTYTHIQTRKENKV